MTCPTDPRDRCGPRSEEPRHPGARRAWHPGPRSRTGAPL
jgi:hypothetical protein